MATTIGILHSRCIKKFNNANTICDRLDIPSTRAALVELREEYMLTVVDIINTYTTGNNDGSALWAEYMSRVSSNNIFGQLDRIIEDIAENAKNDDTVLKLLLECDNAKTDEIIIQPPTLDCPDCGTYHAGRCVCERTDRSQPSTTVLRKRHGSYDRGRHCRVALKKILTEITFVLPPADEQRIADWFRRYPNNNMAGVSCKTLRLCMRDTRLTKYNMFIPYIRKLLTGATPLRISQDEQDTICKRAEAAFMILKDPYGNMPFYQYLVYKVVELLYADDHIRRESILSCIHLQRKETTVKNDAKWRRACQMLQDPFYTYKATSLGNI